MMQGGKKRDPMHARFPLAPMSPSIRTLTILLWLLPFSFLAHSFLLGQQFSGAVALTLFLLYGAVWAFCRPSRFELSASGLTIVFPAWTRRVPAKKISEIRGITASEFKEAYGRAMRIGVGGLWGGFGWLWTVKAGSVEFYVSRVDGLVLLEKKNGKKILITPDRPSEFLQHAPR